ncbi:MAG: hypothetical protein SFW09_23385 [Hyphomicrobiaceae bacterium]|nr:hypothetical protein [Hyphomicrobiaceae bacterium]MDX2159460.1 hypothetical protein [Hyphomicrobiaceae bacterium]
MKTLVASILALGLLTGAASASTLTTQTSTSTVEWCPPPYYGH